MAGGDPGRGHRIHVRQRDFRRAPIVLGCHLALLLERGAAEIQPIPAACRPHGIDPVCFRLCLSPLVDPRIVCPIGIDLTPLACKFTQNRKRLPPVTPRKFTPSHSDGNCSRTCSMIGTRSYGEIVIDQEHALCALRRAPRDIAHRLRRILHMDHRQHRGAGRFEGLAKCVSVHVTVRGAARHGRCWVRIGVRLE